MGLLDELSDTAGKVASVLGLLIIVGSGVNWYTSNINFAIISVLLVIIFLLLFNLHKRVDLLERRSSEINSLE